MKPRRRDLLAGLGGYSLIISGQDIPPSRFDSVTPPSERRRPSPEEPHMTLAELACDVLVAGGGLAGVCAALSAARHGARVVLLQDRSRLGGNSSSEVKMHVVGATCHKGRPGWREGGLIEELRLDDAVNNPQRCWELWDLLLYDKVMREPSITLLLETTLYAAAVRDGRIQHVMARCDRSEHLYRIAAAQFIDCTGDSRLALEAGAEMRTGREARGEFNESLAPEKADQETLGSSILFTSRRYPQPMPFTPPAWARKVTKEHLNFRSTNSWEYGYWWVEWGGHLSPIHDNERIRFELLSIVMGVWDYIKNSGAHPDAANWALDWVGMMPGRRGSRRVVGDHLLTQHDLMKGTVFPDAVAMGGWPLDDHPPGGFDRSDLPPNTVLRPPEPYAIPLGALYSKNVANLFMAGRNISATHAAFTSTRVMATCAACGQAAGTAAAQCVRDRLTPRQLRSGAAHVKKLQQALLRDDQSIPGLRNEDDLDLARTARIAASAGDAAIVTDGFTRDIPAKEVHHWSAPLGGGGAWIELSWPQPVRLSRVQLVFDSGFQRELTLTSSDSINKGIVRAAQPETVKDYRLLADGRTVAEVRGNYQRLRRHEFATIEVSRLRLHVTAAQASDFARVFEIRCYA